VSKTFYTIDLFLYLSKKLEVFIMKSMKQSLTGILAGTAFLSLSGVAYASTETQPDPNLAQLPMQVQELYQSANSCADISGSTLDSVKYVVPLDIYIPSDPELDKTLPILLAFSMPTESEIKTSLATQYKSGQFDEEFTVEANQEIYLNNSLDGQTVEEFWTWVVEQGYEEEANRIRKDLVEGRVNQMIDMYSTDTYIVNISEAVMDSHTQEVRAANSLNRFDTIFLDFRGYTLEAALKCVDTTATENELALNLAQMIPIEGKNFSLYFEATPVKQ